ncbi:MAG: class I SAM-dependent methyltransferase [Candidatus Omnitrophica bacterium]|nr:class I SAM-dependent methyltransferase [Candidatus Omnitrophota bacterium]
MRYIPKIDDKEIKDNQGHFKERVSLYKKKGLDLLGSRRLIFEKAGPLEGSILEIGCGNGYASIVLAESGYDFVAVDPDQESLKTTALNLASRNLLRRVTLYAMDGKAMTFANKSFDNIIMIGLMHHVFEADEMFLETDRVLNQDGLLIIADFNEKGMQIIDSVHREEGRTHEKSETGKDYAYTFFHKLGYEVENFQDDCHWALICQKRIKP